MKIRAKIKVQVIIGTSYESMYYLNKILIDGGIRWGVTENSQAIDDDKLLSLDSTIRIINYNGDGKMSALKTQNEEESLLRTFCNYTKDKKREFEFFLAQDILKYPKLIDGYNGETLTGEEKSKMYKIVKGL